MGGGPVDNDDDQDSMQLPDTQTLRQHKTYHTLCNSYVAPHRDLDALHEAKKRILGHKPGDWIMEAGGMTASDYDVPDMTTLLLVGFEGSGKTTLANMIARAFESADHGQVSHNPLLTETFFLHEYLIPRKSKTLCVYDTPSLSTDKKQNYKMLESWIMKGVRHGEKFEVGDSDGRTMKEAIKMIAREGNFSPFCKRNVNFVIFVISGISIRESMDGNDNSFIESLYETFHFPLLSFKDNRPAVVVTHGDMLTSKDRAHIRTYLGELLGIPPVDQIFEIPGKTDHDTELAIMDMLQYSIEQSDRNIASKPYYLVKSQRIFCLLNEQLPQLDIVIITFCFSMLLLRLILKYL